MKVDLTPDAIHWVEAGLASGRFANAEDAVRFAINRAKRSELREMIDAAEAEGGEITGDDARGRIRAHLDGLSASRKAS